MNNPPAYEPSFDADRKTSAMVSGSTIASDIAALPNRLVGIQRAKKPGRRENAPAPSSSIDGGSEHRTMKKIRLTIGTKNRSTSAPGKRADRRRRSVNTTPIQTNGNAISASGNRSRA